MDIERSWQAAKVDHDSHDLILSAALVGEENTSADVLGGTVRELSALLSTRVTLAAIEQRKHELVMLHACAIALPEGDVVAFVGPSGRGKTTLATALGRHFGYVTDETVGIAADGTVLPYQKPLSVIDALDPGAKKQVSPAALGLRSLPDRALHIAAIVLLDRDDTAPEPPVVDDVDPVEALVRLVPELSYLPELPNPLQRLADLIDGVGGVRRLHYRESTSVPVLVPEIIGAQRSTNWRPLPVASFTSPSAECYTRVQALDAIAIDEYAVLLLGSRVVVLDGIGPAIWDSLHDGPTLDVVVARVLIAVGPAGDMDPSPLVIAALDAMVDSGVVEYHNCAERTP